MEKQKQKRTTLRALTTKLIAKIETTVSANPTIEVLEELWDELLLKQQQLNDIDLEIQNGIKDVNEINDEIIKCDEYSSSIIRTKSKIKRAIDKRIPVSKPELSSTVTEQKTNTSTRIYEPCVKLPLLSIEKFSGDPSDWQRFWDQFESAIHNNAELSNVEKFNYLRSYLIGPAENSIKGFSLTNQNYNSALDTLKERFGKKTLVVNAHLNKLLNLNPVRKSSDVHSLRRLFDICQTETRNLQSLGIKEENYSAIFSPLLIKLLPQDIVLEITKKCESNEEWNINEILQILKTEVECREKANILMDNESRSHPSSAPFPIRVSGHSTKSNDKQMFQRGTSVNPSKSLASSSGLLNDSGERKITCLYCGHEHYLSQCGEFANLPLKDKYDFLRKKGLCFRCISAGHRAYECRRNIKCNNCLNGGSHHKILCPGSSGDNIEKRKEKKNEKHSKDSETDTALANKTCRRNVMLQTLLVRLRNKNKGKEILTRAILDSASQFSYISKKVVREIGYTSEGEQNMKHCLFGGTQESQTHKLYRVFLSDLDKNYLCNFEVYDQQKICTDIPKIADGPWIKEAKKEGIIFSDYEYSKGSQGVNNEIDLLIGADVYGKLLTGKVKLLSSGLCAIETRLGWTVSGKIPESHSNCNTSLLTLSLHFKSDRLKDLWDLDSLGIRDPVEAKSKEDLNDEALVFFNSTVNREPDGRYQVALPWVCDLPKIPSNRAIAERRLKSTVHNLKNSGYLEAYQTVFKEWEEEKIIEDVSDSSPHEGHFLPHRPVIRQSSTTKIRPVFDGSAKEKHSFSLNDCLAKGPNLIELIPSILHRFRKGKIGVIADIKKAFLQISLKEKDRNFLKFLWWEDGDSSRLKTFRHCRVVFGINSSPFLLAATLTHLLSQVEEPYKETAEKLKRSFYVDNCVSSVESKQELEDFIYNSKYILSSAQFDLRGWQHNPVEENTKEGDETAREEQKNESNNVPVLGLQWNVSEDTLSLLYSREIEEKQELISKRLVLSTVSQIFDPIGFSCPVTLIPKLMLQDTWKLKLSWDSTLPNDMVQKFNKWKEQLDILKDIQIPRKLSPYNLISSEISVHIFCDASKTSYATCIFLRVKDGDNISCQLLQAKSRVAPLKKVTIPRLELLACVIGARLAKSIISELQLENLEIHFWSDSSNVLHWIKNYGNWATFVQNRINEIRSLSNPENWHHVPGKLNPADLPSRGCSVKQLLQSKWWEGPSWLYLPKCEWPQSEEPPDENILLSEQRKTILAVVKEDRTMLDWYFKRFSSFNKLCRVTAWIFRFFHNVKFPSQKASSQNLSVDEIQTAEKVLFRLIQKDSFTDLTDKSLRSLRVIEDKDGILRTRTNVAYRDDHEDFRYPIILPSNHPVVENLIFERHVNLQHVGVTTLMANLREQFWIIKSRKTIRKILNKCVVCKRFSAQKYEVNPGIPPEDRVKDARIFEITGTDLAGPLYLKDGSKAWIVIYTCAVYRAVHLELVTSVSTESYVQALRRFIARRGKPYIIYSDNGTNFIGANRALNAINWNKVLSIASTHKIRWKFNPPTAAWWGGWWERLIGLVKRLLRKVLGRASLTYEELNTVMCDCEQVVNSRPLTYVSEDDKDPNPLTPMMFLHDLPSYGVPDIDAIDRQKLTKRAKYRQRIRDSLRKRFRLEYLGQLRQSTFRDRKLKPLSVGEIVLIEDNQKQRINWPLCKVIELFPGQDHISRTAKVQTPSGELIRPVQKLYRLELG